MSAARKRRAKRPPKSPIARLAHWFQRNGYVRHQNPTRLSNEGWFGYRKGDEIRLSAESAAELAEMRRCLKLAGFKPGRPFVKGRQYRLPIYGREPVRRLLARIETQSKSRRG